MRLQELNRLLQSIAEQIDPKMEDIHPDSIRQTILRFFKEHDTITDPEIHALADKLGIDHSEFETQVYGLLKDMISGKFFKHWDDPDSNFDPKELAMGIEVEKEHTDDPLWAKIIARAHLSELKNYYTLLKKMEREGKQQQGESKRIK
jgi:hypothetical protein